MASVNHEWNASKLYREPDYSRVNKINPFLHPELIAKETQRLEDQAIRDFVVTKLPRGGEDEYVNFKFDSAVIDQRVKAGRGCSPGHEKVEEQSAESLAAIESRIASGRDHKVEQLNTNNTEL